MPGSLIELSILTCSEAEEAVSALLEETFQESPTSYCQPSSPTVRVAVFLPVKRRPSSTQLRQIRAGLNRIRACDVPVGPARVTVRRLSARDWKESWKQHFKPIEIGRSLLVKPSWSRRKHRKSQAVVVLDPGLSFGTGHHPTTSFCLEQLARARSVDRKQSFLDIGTGSGILAIAACKLGYSPVHAFDSDPQAVNVCKANARRNRVADRIQIVQRDLTDYPRQNRLRYDLVCANLISTLLISERQRILNRVRPGGILVIAGILATEFRETDATYQTSKTMLIGARKQGEWHSAAYRILS